MGSMQLSSTRILELIEILSMFSKDCADSIESAAALISKTFLAGGKVLICGNGRSAADSQHFAAEFVSAFSRDITRRDCLPYQGVNQREVPIAKLELKLQEIISA